MIEANVQFWGVLIGLIALYVSAILTIIWYSKRIDRKMSCARCTIKFYMADMKKLSKLDWKVPGRVCPKCFKIFEKGVRKDRIIQHHEGGYKPTYTGLWR